MSLILLKSVSGLPVAIALLVESHTKGATTAFAGLLPVRPKPRNSPVVPMTARFFLYEGFMKAEVIPEGVLDVTS